MTQPIRLVIAEDEEHLGAILEHFLRGRGYEVTMCRDGKAALDALRTDTYDVALIDIVMPEMDGLEVLRHLQSEPDAPEVIIITGNGTIDTAITAIKLGAYDYISKPYRMAEIDVMVRRAWEKRELSRSNVFLRARIQSVPSLTIHSENESMQSTLSELVALAPSNEVIVLHGAAGVGKSYLTQYIHQHSGRPADAYVELSSHNALVGDLLGQLVGREPAATSDRAGRRIGVLQMAAAGTVVIDINVLDKHERQVLTDILTQRSFSRLGSTRRVMLTTRIIVCDRSVEPLEGVDIPGTHVTIPSLCERSEDLRHLAADLVRDIGDGTFRTLAPDITPVLSEYGWPGNVRELRAVMTRAAILAPMHEVTAADIRMVLMWGGSSNDVGAQLEDLERLHIEATLVRTNWHQGRAADALGISTKTLYRKMREFGFVRPRKRKLARGRVSRDRDA